jgi:hypothetical protein
MNNQEQNNKQCTRLKIPTANQMYDMRHTRELEYEKQVTEKQQKIIEDAFTAYNGEKDEIVIVLDERLRNSLMKDLYNKGYSIREESTYDSTSTTPQNGKWVVKISVKSSGDEDLYTIRRRVFTPFSAFVPFTPYFF